jgi:hypothetical protein
LSSRTRPLLAAPASILAIIIVITAAAISVFASSPSDVETHAQIGTGEHQVHVPGLASNAEGTHVPFPTPTPATPTPSVGVQDAPNRLFVSETTGRDKAAGTRAEPLATLAEALELARDIDDAEIYVAIGSYNETIRIIGHSGVKLLGGYDVHDWERDPGQRSSVFQPERVALLIDSSESVHVEGFHLPAGGHLLGGPLQRSRVAVIVEFSSGVTLKDNYVLSGSGLGGINGTQGIGGAQGARGQDGHRSGVCPPTNQGGPGGSGAANGGRGGDGGAIDGWDGSNGQNASANVRGGQGGTGGVFVGGAGAHGGQGGNGTSNVIPGASGGSLVYFTVDGDYQPAHGEDGRSTNRLGGAGGGGGGGQAGGLFFLCGGGGGGGGGGGHPAESDGTGGQSGGASFGIFVRGSDVTVIDNEIQTGDGGRGGQGGSSGIGGLGGNGGSGGDNAGNGGRGGRGASSAPGGGGGGGPSIGIIADGGSEITGSGNTFDLGQPGVGGFGGTFPNLVDRAPTGATGLRLEFYHDVPIGLPEPPQPTN